MSYKNFTLEKNIVCKLLSIIPDKFFLRVLYKIKTGRHLDLDTPKTFSEKLNWLKIYDRNPLYSTLVDKYEVRNYVRSRIGEKYLFDLLGVWDQFDEIDFGQLPDQFVLKCTHDYGSIIIVDDINRFDKVLAKRVLCTSLRYNFYYRGREWAYKNVKPRIIAEKYMTDGNNRLVDYKFFCFNGKVEFMFIATGRGSDLRFDFFTRNFEHIETTNGVPNADVYPLKPENYEAMIEVAEKLAKGINNVRVDLYNIDGRIYFSEMTFYHNGGMVVFEPYDTDVKLGEKFVMEKYK